MAKKKITWVEILNFAVDMLEVEAKKKKKIFCECSNCRKCKDTSSIFDSLRRHIARAAAEGEV